MVHRPSIFSVAALLFFSSVPSRGIAGDAVFSSDGKKIYAITDAAFGPAGQGDAERGDRPGVEEIDLEAKTIRTIATTELLRGIACTNQNKFFCVTESALSSFDPRSEKLTKIRDASPGTNFWQIAYNPKMKRVFVTTDREEGTLFTFQDAKEWLPVRVRRHPYLACPVFAASGELFFAADGDLWHGEIQDEADEGKHYFSVAAYRYAPLATLETQNTTPAEIGVHDIGVSRDTVYVQLSRMGGSGDGWFARLARPALKRDADGNFDMEYEPSKRLPIYQQALQSLTIIGDDFHAGSICVSPDEQRVHYVFERKHWLVTNGKTEELHLRPR